MIGEKQMSKCNSCVWYQNQHCTKFNTKTIDVSFCMQYIKLHKGDT